MENIFGPRRGGQRGGGAYVIPENRPVANDQRGGRGGRGGPPRGRPAGGAARDFNFDRDNDHRGGARGGRGGPPRGRPAGGAARDFYADGDNYRGGYRGGRGRGGRGYAPRGRGFRGDGEGAENDFGRPWEREERPGYARDGARGFAPHKHNVLTKLIGLSNEENAEDIALQIINPHFGFIELMQNPQRIKLHHLPNLFRVLIRVLEDEDAKATTLSLLQHVVDSNFMATKMQDFVSRDLLLLQENLGDLETAQSFLVDMFRVFAQMFIRVESLAYEKLFLLVSGMESTVRVLENNRSRLFSDEVRTAFDDLMEMTKAVMEKRVQSLSLNSRHPEKKKSDTFDTRKPPNDFREISTVPTAIELTGPDSRNIFLRPNCVEGRYPTVNDYLDVQYRLMREDFVEPLREGIQEYLFLLQQPARNRGKVQNIRVYQDTEVYHPMPAEGGIAYLVRFSLERLRRVNWEMSKRLIFGSLLCLSNDNFETIYFATVADRNADDLKVGYITVRFVDRVPPNDVKYIMVETVGYFEAYRHVLERLQQLDVDRFPMEDYIVKCNTEVKAPEYLARNQVYVYDLSVIVDDKEIVSAKRASMRIRPMGETKWPHYDDLGLDPSQFAALKTALTHEVALIQGPPGTGKTFLGLKCVKVLVESVQNQMQNFGPIVVVCFTNHALDQFLEGIANFMPHGAIVRVGGRSKSEVLQKFSISYLRQQMVQDRRVPMDIFRRMGGLKEDLGRTGTELVYIRAEIDRTANTIVFFDRLDYVMSANHKSQLQSLGINSKQIMRSWLLGTVDTFEFSPRYEYAFDNFVEMLLFEEIDENVAQLFDEIQANPNMDNYNTEIDILAEAQWETDQRRIDDDEDNIQQGRKKLEAQLAEMRKDEEDDFNPGDGWMTQISTKNMKRLIARKISNRNVMPKNEVDAVNQLWDLSLEDRWRLYHYWIDCHLERLKATSLRLEERYNALSQEKNELRLREDLEILRTAKIVGLTTTGAARYGSILSRLGARIVIVEEAAEVLESHVIASLNPGCQHLILIGDHQQLKPSAAVYRLAKDFHLDISLFERLIKNDVHFDVLALQHRMRPEIANIMRHIYKDLRNHESVNNYPVVQGVSSNIFFLNHRELESFQDEIKSYSNEFEATFAVGLCKHFLMNGYTPDQITILTLYSGQLFMFKKMMPKHVYKGVRVCVVDNFQGEENDIIILSLVRSNEEEKIGFVGIENRVCVALSRAKYGLYVLGNFDLLASKNKLWNDIVSDLRRKRQLGQSLELRCQLHPEQIPILIKQADDFSRAPEGGCSELCNRRLACGHACLKACHPMDLDHIDYKCRKPCARLCLAGHPCKQKCFQECSPCDVKVEKVVPKCGHRQKIPCHLDPDKFKCQLPCTRLLDNCEHRCRNMCGEACTVHCLENVVRTLSFCGHKVKIPCGEKNPDNFPCPYRCTGDLGCGHACKRTCGECALGRLHETCTSPCERNLLCGHLCKEDCPKTCPPCRSACEEQCLHNKCPEKCGDECVPCNEECAWRCEHDRCTQRCSAMCKRKPCNVSCKKIVRCDKCCHDHPCIGMCGEKCPVECPDCDRDALQEMLFGSEEEDDARFLTLWTCGHTLEVTGLDNWMQTPSDKGEIMCKKCPKCTTVITAKSCFRYLTIVKEINASIRRVQKKFRLKNADVRRRNDISRAWLNVDHKINEMGEAFTVPFLDHLGRNNYELLIEPHTVWDANRLLILDNCARLYGDVYRLYNDNIQVFTVISDPYKRHIFESMRRVLLWLAPNKRRFNEFEIQQFEEEMQRIHHLLGYYKCTKEAERIGHETLPKCKSEIERLMKLTRYSSTDQKETMAVFEPLKKQLIDLVPGLAITKRERAEIVAAVGLSQGHWYMCPNGHPYTIGECGGAMQTSTCPDCGARVGGHNHALTSGNQVATIMDGARHAAWSEEANMGNYALDPFL